MSKHAATSPPALLHEFYSNARRCFASPSILAPTTHCFSFLGICFTNLTPPSFHPSPFPYLIFGMPVKIWVWLHSNYNILLPFDSTGCFSVTLRWSFLHVASYPRGAECYACWISLTCSDCVYLVIFTLMLVLLLWMSCKAHWGIVVVILGYIIKTELTWCPMLFHILTSCLAQSDWCSLTLLDVYFCQK